MNGVPTSLKQTLSHMCDEGAEVISSTSSLESGFGRSTAGSVRQHLSFISLTQAAQTKGSPSRAQN